MHVAPQLHVALIACGWIEAVREQYAEHVALDAAAEAVEVEHLRERIRWNCLEPAVQQVLAAWQDLPKR